MSVVEIPIFDTEQYKVPFPKADGKEVTDLVIRLGGSLNLNRNDPKWAEFVESLTLGKHVTLEVSASVEAKGDTYRFSEKDETEQVVHSVSLRLQSVEPAGLETP